MGFKEGFENWKSALKEGGWMVVSELTWLTKNPDKTVSDYWKTNYPAMKTIEENIKIVQDAGFKVVKTIVLDKDGWMDYYYTPMKELIAKTHDKKLLEIVQSEKSEIEIYEKNWQSYSYVFYICRKE